MQTPELRPRQDLTLHPARSERPAARAVKGRGLLFGLALLSTFSASAALGMDPPTTTFTLPGPNGQGGMFYNDLQNSFPEVDWSDLDRLYLPAAHYRYIFLGNLPQRTADDPLVITNLGGQVRVGGLDFHYNFILSGGSHWVLTGRYDPVAQTGDEAFTGHVGGAYANSRDTYGILIDDAFEDEGNSGLAIGGGATNFEVELVEVRHVGFAGFLIKTDDQGDAHMVDVKLHDNYIHDVGSEGVYIGSTQSAPQHRIDGLRFYNNRVVRTGTEILQLGQLGDGCEIHNNVFFLGALDWRDPFQNFQDNASQIGAREGSGSLHHNLVIGGASCFQQFFPQPRDGDVHQPGDRFDIHHNFFSHSRNFGFYVHAQSDDVTTYRFADNAFREINFQYDEHNPDENDRNAVFISFNNRAPIEITDNLWEGPQTIFAGTSSPNIVVSGNTNGAVEPVIFVDSGLPADFDYHRLEIWADVSGTTEQPVEYTLGDLVLYEGNLYENIAPGTHSGRRPPEHPDTWALRPHMPDDLRLAADSPWQGYGLLDLGSQIFADGFESGNTSRWTGSSG